MDKRKLKLLDVEQLPPVIETSQIPDNQKIKYAFSAKKHTDGKEQILAVTFFSLDKRIPEFRVFFNKNIFITEKLVPERKWSKSTLDRLIYYWYGHVAICANEKTAKLVRGFFNTDGDPYQAMLTFQRDVRQKRLDIRHKKETDRIDAHMRLVPELPKGFETWLNNVAFDKSRYIYYKRAGSNAIDTFCTSCLKPSIYKITKKHRYEHVRHNNTGKCPECGKRITYKAVGKTTRQIDSVNAALTQKTKKGFVVRYFSAIKEYKTNYRHPNITFHERVRDFYEDGQIYNYEWGDFKQTGKYRWCVGQGRATFDTAYLYTRNVKYVLDGTPWQYSGIYELARNTDGFDIFGYLKAYKRYPVYEYLVKLRLYNLVTGNLNSWGEYISSGVDLGGKNIKEVLGIDRQMLKQLQRLNGAHDHLKLIRKAGEAGITLTDAQVSRVIGAGLSIDRFMDILKFTTPHKALNYISRVLSERQTPGEAEGPGRRFGSPENDILSDWSDYIRNCVLLEYDLKNDFVLFPRDLKARHDEAAERVKAHNDELLNSAISGMADALEREYGYRGKRLLIRPPRSADEITAEGQALRHCVGTGSYIKSMATGESIILFVRQNDRPDAPFFTLELENRQVTQCRGERNCGMTEEVQSFVTAWVKVKVTKKGDRSA